MEDLAFYWTHRFLHLPSLYPHVHKMHHESISTISLSAISTHPLEFIFGNLLPVKFGSMLCPFKAHLSTMLLFSFFRTLNTVLRHSGYEFPVGLTKFIPLGAAANYHNYHHLVNVGNYGTEFIIWDSIFGTNKEYFKQIETTLQTKERGGVTKLKRE